MDMKDPSLGPPLALALAAVSIPCRPEPLLVAVLLRNDWSFIGASDNMCWAARCAASIAADVRRRLVRPIPLVSEGADEGRIASSGTAFQDEDVALANTPEPECAAVSRHRCTAPLPTACGLLLLCDLRLDWLWLLLFFGGRFVSNNAPSCFWCAERSCAWARILDWACYPDRRGAYRRATATGIVGLKRAQRARRKSRRGEGPP